MSAKIYQNKKLKPSIYMYKCSVKSDIFGYIYKTYKARKWLMMIMMFSPLGLKSNAFLNSIKCFIHLWKTVHLFWWYMTFCMFSFLRNEKALKNFNDAYFYLRGNRLINYQQLGLKSKLYLCEVRNPTFSVAVTILSYYLMQFFCIYSFIVSLCFFFVFLWFIFFLWTRFWPTEQLHTQG